MVKLKNSLLILITLFAMNNVHASHIVGGEIYYDYLGNNQYRIYIAVYRDCNSTGAAYDSPLPLGVFDGNNVRVMNIDVPFPGSTVLPIIFDNPCVTAPSGICTERAIYTIVLNLPPTPGGYTLSYQRCCRGPNITNLVNPDDTGLTLQTHIPTSNNNFYINSSPRFTNYPPLVICNNENLNFDHSATDPDGDSLAYQLVTPNSGANSINPAPNPIPNPPYGNVVWGSNFSAATPLGPGSTTTINPVTGQLFVDANLLGLYVVGIRVNEYRNGVLIGSTTRDFLFRVVNCVVQLSAEVTSQENTPGFVSYCNGLTFTFDNQSFGASSYYWDFGVSGIVTDNSTAFEPTYTFPQPGTYQVMLVANPGWPCTDTTYVDLILENPFDVDFTFIDSTCFIDNTLDFTGVIINGPPATQFNWDFGPNASPAVATTQNVPGVVYSSSQNNTVTLIGSYSVCADTITKPVFFFDKPVPISDFPVNHECEGFTQTFINNSTGSVSYFWDFGDPSTTTDVSTQNQPTYTYPGPGTYTVTLIAQSGPNCSDTSFNTISVYEPLSVDFTHNDSLCITSNSFNFIGNVSGPSITSYLWNFGPNANPSTASTLNVNNVVYSQAGQIPVSLTASFLGCSETATDMVFIFDEPYAGFTITDELKCEPYPAHFVNTSSYDAPLLYYWDFGDGNTSTAENPTNIYLNAGQYSVSLTVISTYGCVDTITVIEPDVILIHPKPNAGFTVDRTTVTICDSQVQFTDQSQDAVSVVYDFDDMGLHSDQWNPLHTFLSEGTLYPHQYVTTEFGCVDTAFLQIIVEPFTVFVPNTFTPDGNTVNNDFFALVGIEPIEWEMTIYNRWGEQVFKSNDPYARWDATYNGIPCKEGMYSYVIRFVSCAPYANSEIITGHVSLLR